MTPEYIVALVVGAVGAVWVYLKTTYFPHRQEMEKTRLAHQLELEKKKEEAAEKQRQHEQLLASQKAEEDRKQREFEREMVKLKTEQEGSEEGNTWKQMVQLQSEVMNQNKDFAEFIIGLATERYDQERQEARQTLRELSELGRQDLAKSDDKWSKVVNENTSKWSLAQGEYRNLHTQLSILVSETVRREEDREIVKRVPELIAQLLIQQAHYQDTMNKLCEKINARLSDDLQ